MWLKDDMDPDSVGISLSWENVVVHEKCKSDFSLKKILRNFVANDEPNKLLDAVTGHAKGGNFVAIMGPSGAGKTTLLAVLAKKIELSSGCIRVNGCSVTKDEMSTISGYLPQFDALPSALTAMEYMLFTCALRLDKKTSRKERDILANNIFTQLGLLRSSDTLISTLSGGEKKRLSLAVELVTKPKILFLDEPTSGLDTCTAMRVIESAKAEVRNGTLVFCTIHQPAMDLYKMFSHVIILANGKTSYYGTLGNATRFFNSKGFHCPESFNEAEYYVKVVSRGNLIDSLNATDSILLSQYSARVHSSFLHSTCSKDFEFRTSKPNQFVQFYWVAWRIAITMRRTMFQDIEQHVPFLVRIVHPGDNNSKNFSELSKKFELYQSIYMSAIMLALFYYGMNSKNQSGIQNVRGAFYVVSSQIIFTTAYSIVYIMPNEMPLYLRENSIYNPSTYYIATIIGWIPKAVFHALGFIWMMFLALDINLDFTKLVQFTTYVVMASIASSAYGAVVSSWIENTAIAMTVMGPIDLITFMMAGIFYNIRSLPAYLSWFKYLSIFYYINEAMAIIHWTSIDSIECYRDKNLPCLRNGREVLAEYGYNEFNLWADAGGLVLLTLGMHVFGYLGVKRRRAVKSIY